MQGTRERILSLIVERREMRVEELAAELGITATAVRRHLDNLRAEGVLKSDPILDQVAAVSCGVFQDVPVLDLDYEEDSSAEADSNFVLTGSGSIVEIQATGEKRGFTRDEFERLFSLAERHQLRQHGRTVQAFNLTLTDLQRKVLALLGVPASTF